MYTLITKDDCELLYKRLQSAHVVGALISGEDFEKYTQFMMSAIIKSVGQLVSEIHEKPNFSQELMKMELTEGMNACLENKELTDEFGELWLARENRLIEVVETIANSVMDKLISDYQATFN